MRSGVALAVAACAVVISINSEMLREMLFGAPVGLLPTRLEPIPGVAQCNYEMLRAFSEWARTQTPQIRYTLGAGTLLGAMRTRPAGLLQWEHDVDLYIPAKDASEVLRLLRQQCGGEDRAGWNSPWCETLHYKGLVDEDGKPCCGFGCVPSVGVYMLSARVQVQAVSSP